MARTVTTINISQIQYKGRLPINQKALSFAVEMKFRNAIFPPISVERLSGGDFRLSGGRHRLAAHKLLGRKTIRVSVAKERA